jgi:hypothetical protein
MLKLKSNKFLHFKLLQRNILIKLIKKYESLHTNI